MTLEFENVFKISLSAMKLNRCHPALKKDKKWLALFLVYHGIFTTVFILIIYNIIFHNLKNSDFSETCKNGILFIVYVVVTFQYSIMVWKQDVLLNLIGHMKRDYDLAATMPIEDRKILIQYAKNGEYVCKQWLFISILTCVVFLIKNFVLITHHWWSFQELKMIPLYDLVYPSAIEERKENVLVYIALYALMLFYAIYGGIVYVAFVPLGPSFMLHACGQLELVKLKIDALFKSGLDDVEDKLKDIINHLQYIYSFVEDIKISFRVAYELTLKGSSLLLPITCYEVIEALRRGEMPLEFITFIIGGVLISSSPCFYSDLLMEKGENVRLAIYSCGWESYNSSKIRSSLRIVLLRALRPVGIRTLFRTVCLDALTDLFQQAYTIFNLMNAMWN